MPPLTPEGLLAFVCAQAFEMLQCLPGALYCILLHPMVIALLVIITVVAGYKLLYHPHHRVSHHH